MAISIIVHFIWLQHLFFFHCQDSIMMIWLQFIHNVFLYYIEWYDIQRGKILTLLLLLLNMKKWEKKTYFFSTNKIITCTMCMYMLCICYWTWTKTTISSSSSSYIIVLIIIIIIKFNFIYSLFHQNLMCDFYFLLHFYII